MSVMSVRQCGSGLFVILVTGPLLLAARLAVLDFVCIVLQNDQKIIDGGLGGGVA